MQEEKAESKEDFSFGDVLIEFLEVSINLILYVRSIYPDGIFKKVQKYGISVMMSQHPDVNEYIKDVLSTIQQFVNKGEIYMLVLQITNNDNQPLEKFCFEMKLLENQSKQCFLDMETHLRALLLKINTCESMLQPLPNECSFQVLVHTKRLTLSQMQESSTFMDFPWIRSENTNKSQQGKDEPVIIPIRSCSTQAFVLQCFVEEKKTKN